MSPRSTTKILFVGDMHLGRRASRVPAAAWERGHFQPHDISPEGAWQRVVQAALAADVQSVALAGDLVDQDDDLFEARAVLEDGICKLAAAGISVLAVAGNHDTRIMPLLTRVIDDLHLLGPAGTWSGYQVAPGVRVVGWSFPARHHTASPLALAPPPPVPGVVTLGLLHADRDAARSRYAPVATADLRQIGYQGWALGHVHLPDAVPGADDPARPFYLGSISGAVPSETGAHGPVLATITADGAVHWERWVLAPLRWERISIPIADLVSAGALQEVETDLRNFLLEKIDAVDPGPDWAEQQALALGLRLTLTGDHRRAAAIQQASESLDRDKLVTLVDGRVVFVERITCEIGVPVDLATLAIRDDPPGLLAREVLALQRGDAATAPLLNAARRALDQIPVPAGDATPAWTDDELRAHLARVGQCALNALLSQDAGGAG